MEFKCSNGTTWDSIAYIVLNDEFLMDSIIKDSYSFCDVVTFDGGESVQVNTQKAVKSSTIKTPWEN